MLLIFILLCVLPSLLLSSLFLRSFFLLFLSPLFPDERRYAQLSTILCSKAVCISVTKSYLLIRINFSHLYRGKKNNAGVMANIRNGQRRRESIGLPCCVALTLMCHKCLQQHSSDNKPLSGLLHLHG